MCIYICVHIRVRQYIYTRTHTVYLLLLRYAAHVWFRMHTASDYGAIVTP
jgi:hypothetical protein